MAVSIEIGDWDWQHWIKATGGLLVGHQGAGPLINQNGSTQERVILVYFYVRLNAA